MIETAEEETKQNGNKTANGNGREYHYPHEFEKINDNGDFNYTFAPPKTQVDFESHKNNYNSFSKEATYQQSIIHQQQIQAAVHAARVQQFQEIMNLLLMYGNKHGLTGLPGVQISQQMGGVGMGNANNNICTPAQVHAPSVGNANMMNVNNMDNMSGVNGMGSMNNMNMNSMGMCQNLMNNMG